MQNMVVQLSGETSVERLRQLQFAKQSNEEEEGATQRRNLRAPLDLFNSSPASGFTPYNQSLTIQLVCANLITSLSLLTTILASE